MSGIDKLLGAVSDADRAAVQTSEKASHAALAAQSAYHQAKEAKIKLRQWISDRLANVNLAEYEEMMVAIERMLEIVRAEAQASRPMPAQGDDGLRAARGEE